MSKSIKAALWSGLVFPGAGHLYLKCYGRGIGLIAVSAFCLFIIISKSTEQAMAVLEKIEADGGMVDPSRVLALVSQASTSVGTPTLTIATMVIIACWVVGVVDAYRLGKR
ncbi:MAG: hypothetical protein Q8L39_16605 [Burkholderiales bacterium]|nr:hypothetical protein [Burkholderiales bacterium]